MGAKRHEALGGLTIKEQRFIELYLFGDASFCGNGGKCYTEAYDYKGKRESAWVEACNLLKKKHIKEALNRLLEEELGEEGIKRGIRSIVRKETTADRDKLRGLELLGKTHAMFKEKLEQDIKIEGLVLSEEGFEEDNE